MYHSFLGGMFTSQPGKRGLLPGMHTARDCVSLAKVKWKKNKPLINRQFAIFFYPNEVEQEAPFWVCVAQQSWKLLPLLSLLGW